TKEGAMHYRAVVLTVATAIICGGCVNPFDQYYSGQPDARMSPVYDSSYVVSGDRIPVYTSDDPERDVRTLRIKGFDVIGVSSFYGPDNQVNPEQVQSQGRKVGAHIILVKSKYKDTVSGAVPLVLPNNTTSYSTGSATAYGPGGSATAYGSSTTTTYGTQTAIIPYSVSRSDYVAVFLAKARQRVGIYPIALTDEERRSLKTNSAVRVDFVVEGTPAFNADVFPGDYVVRLNDDVVSSPDTYVTLLNKYEGRDVTFHFVRDGKPLSKLIHINAITATQQSTGQ
ncbi:MAG: PDZ domain-containing protein, partial [Nitrososphaera sp.]